MVTHKLYIFKFAISQKRRVWPLHLWTFRLWRRLKLKPLVSNQPTLSEKKTWNSRAFVGFQATLVEFDHVFLNSNLKKTRKKKHHNFITMQHGVDLIDITNFSSDFSWKLAAASIGWSLGRLVLRLGTTPVGVNNENQPIETLSPNGSVMTCYWKDQSQNDLAQCIGLNR